MCAASYRLASSAHFFIAHSTADENVQIEKGLPSDRRMRMFTSFIFLTFLVESNAELRAAILTVLEDIEAAGRAGDVVRTIISGARHVAVTPARAIVKFKSKRSTVG
jgi:hypothetical protein